MELWNYRPKIIIHGILFLISNFLEALLIVYFYSQIKHHLYDFLFFLAFIALIILTGIILIPCFLSFIKLLRYEWQLDDNKYWKAFFVFVGIAFLSINLSAVGCFTNYLNSNKVTFGYSDYYLEYSDIGIFIRNPKGTVRVRANGNTFEFSVNDGSFSSYLNELNISDRIEIDCKYMFNENYISYSFPYNDFAEVTIYKNGSIFTEVGPDLNPTVTCLYYYDSSKFDGLYNLCQTLYENSSSNNEI